MILNLTDWLETLFHSDWYYKGETEGERDCPVCNQHFVTHRNLAEHMLSSHSESKEYFDKYLDDLNSMLRHPLDYFSVHESYGLFCSMCGKRFNSNSELSRHINTTHKRDIEFMKKELDEKKLRKQA